MTKTDNSSNVYYYHTDGLGSITKLTNSSGALIEQYSYDVYGKTTIKNASGTVISSSAYNNRFMYTGAEYVSPTGLYSMRNRFYSPSLGRFLQPDPIGHSGDAYNIYRYCGNGPTNATDPNGTNPYGCGIIGFALNTNGGGGGGAGSDTYGNLNDFNTGGLGSPTLGWPTGTQVTINPDGSLRIQQEGGFGSENGQSSPATFETTTTNSDGSVTIQDPSQYGGDDAGAPPTIDPVSTGLILGGITVTVIAIAAFPPDAPAVLTLDAAEGVGVAGNATTGAVNTWWGGAEGLEAAQASGGTILTISPAAEAAAEAGDYSLVVQESQAAAQAASGAQQAFLGSQGGSIFLGTELPTLLANPAVTTIEITF